MKKTLHPFWFNVSPWVILGTLAILIPILTIMTIRGVQRQQASITELLREKGFAMIRSFEAAIRTGPGQPWNAFLLQKFLMETSRHADIDYVVITDRSGTIIADSDPTVIGDQYDMNLSLEKIAADLDPGWRQFVRSDGADTFEVYKSLPTVKIDLGGDAIIGQIKPPLILFIGLDTGPLSLTKTADMRHTIWMGIIFFLIGCSGIISLILAQAYRSSESSLSRMTILSDTIIDKMPIGLVLLDARKKLTTMNPAGEALLGLQMKEMLGKPLMDRLPPSWQELITGSDHAAPAQETEIEYPLGSGKTISLDMVVTRLSEEKGAFIGYLLLFRDMTEMILLRKEMAQTQRLASLGSLAAGIAHEIRNPLSSIKGFATYFREKYKDTPEDGEIAEVLIGEVERLNRVIGQLLDFARPLTMKRRDTELRGLIGHSLRMVGPQAAEKGIHIERNLPEEKLFAWIDDDKISQVLLNLYLNAFDAMEPGGLLTVSLSQPTDTMREITVSDTGRGIHRQDLPHVYDPYFTTKSSGTGLGLAIVHRIVEAHNGHVHIRSEEEEGTSVTILLPAEEAFQTSKRKGKDS